MLTFHIHTLEPPDIGMVAVRTHLVQLVHELCHGGGAKDQCDNSRILNRDLFSE